MFIRIVYCKWTHKKNKQTNNYCSPRLKFWPISQWIKPSLAMDAARTLKVKRFKLWIRSWGCSLGSISWILEYSGYIALGQIGFKWLVFIYGYNVFKWLQWYNGGIGNTFTLVPVRWFQASLYQWRHPFTMGPILDGFFWVLSFDHPWPI